MTDLLILVNSTRADGYINSVVHNIRNKRVTSVTFLQILGTTEADPDETGRASRVMAAVRAAITALADEGTYAHQGQLVPLNTKNGKFRTEVIKEYYSSINSATVDYRSSEIDYRDLRKYLRNYAKTHGAFIVDITNARKRLLGDFISLALVDGIKDIYTFDLLDAPDFSRPWNSLIHAIDNPAGYRYVSILETPIYRDSSRVLLVRSPRIHAAWALSATIICAGLAINYQFGMDSVLARWINVAATFATLAALVLVFFPPRAP